MQQNAHGVECVDAPDFSLQGVAVTPQFFPAEVAHLYFISNNGVHIAKVICAEEIKSFYFKGMQQPVLGRCLNVGILPKKQQQE
jgi:hypothetical protein